jgi:uncharacterized repeat protein (TIGR01451 family)
MLSLKFAATFSIQSKRERSNMKPAYITQPGKLAADSHFGRIRFLGLALIVSVIAAATLYSTSSASSLRVVGSGMSGTFDSGPSSGAVRTTRWGLPAIVDNNASGFDLMRGFTPMSQPPFTPSITLYASDCTTPKTTFQRSEVVCASITGVPLVLNIRVDWLNTTNLILQQGSQLATDPQTVTFTIPPNAQLGEWHLNVASASDSSVQATLSFFVNDPQTPTANLSISKLAKEGDGAAGSDVGFDVIVTNTGPDAAANVVLTDSVPSGTTFQLGSQVSGPSFTCNNPAGGASTGTSTCTLASLAPGDSASFQFEYRVDNSATNGTVISNTASVTSNTTDPKPSDNTASAQIDVVPSPCVISCPSDVTVSNDANQFGAVVTFSPATGSGACGTVTSNYASGSFFPVGTTVVTAAGDAGNACSFNVTVNDTQAPTFNSCPTDSSVTENPSGSGSATVTYASPTASDNDPAGATVSCDHPSGSSFPVGTTAVICTATDAAGNTNTSCTFNVTVTTLCSISCPASIVQNVDAASCGAVVTYSTPTTNNCSGSETVTQIAGLASGATFPVGTTTNTFRVTDGSVTSTCSFTVTVVDNIAPSISCPADINVTATGSSCQTAVSVTAPSATDNCSHPPTVTGARDDGQPLTNAYPVGTTAIKWTATDAAGNQSSCEQKIFVHDTTAPTASVNVPDTVVGALMTVSADATTCLAPVPDLTTYLTASDNCATTLAIVQTPTADSGNGDSLVGAGPHPITIKVSDGDPTEPGTNTTTVTQMNIVHVQLDSNGNPVLDSHGNPVVTIVSTVDMVFTVVDNTPPTFTFVPAAVTAYTGPTATTCDTVVDPGTATATDTCGAVTVTRSPAGNTFAVGTTTITWTATDAAGNTATATQTVTVIDNTPPLITTNGQTPSMWPPNHKYQTFQLTNFVTGASDNCGGVGINDVVIEKVTSDEIENGNGDGNTMNDIVIAADCKSVQLRSEREGSGDGRVYTITFKVTDTHGNVGRATARVVVPHNRGETAVDSGVHYTVNGTCP